MSISKTIKKVVSEISENALSISKTEGKSKLIISFDMLYCLLKYSASPNNYEKFEFYNLSASQRKTYVTFGLSRKMIKKFNNPHDIDWFEDKLKFAEKFNDMFGRDYLNVESMTFEEFKKFCQNKDKFICKSINGSQGADIKVYHLDNLEQIFAELKQRYNTGYMIEEWIHQHTVLSEIYPDAVNCLRIITVFDGKKVHLLTGGVTFGIESEIANGSQPSIVAPVNFKNGIMEKHAATFKSPLYEKHPKTNAQILGVQLPFWDEIKQMLEVACRRIPTVGYIGWDIAIKPEGPVLIEGNTTPGYKYYQIPKHLEDGIGNKHIYEIHLKSN